jgi:hypothetical protein
MGMPDGNRYCRRLLANAYVRGLAAGGLEVPTLGRPPTADPAAEGFGKVKPSVIYLDGDPTGLVNHIVGKSWGGPRAYGAGSGFYVAPRPDHGQGDK